MDKVHARKPTVGERWELHRLKGQRANAVNHRHGRIILLSHGGIRNREIAIRCDCTPTWVRNVIHRFNAEGIEGIRWAPYYCTSHGPRKFFAEVAEQIAEVALSPPRQLIGMSVWSLAKLRSYLLEKRIVHHISLEQLRQILRRAKVRWRHTKSWKESNDPDFWAKYRQIRNVYKYRRSAGIRLCIDEFGPLNIQPRHGPHMAPKGRPDRVPATYHRHHGVRYAFGVYNLENDTLRTWFHSKKNRRTFLSFLRWLRRIYRDRGILYIVLDNVSYHRTREVLKYAKRHRIRLYFTPTNASWLNRIESHFTAIRKFVLDNTNYQSHDEQEAAIRRYVSWRNRCRRIGDVPGAKTCQSASP